MKLRRRISGKSNNISLYTKNPKKFTYRKMVDLSHWPNLLLAQPVTSAVQVTLQCDSKCSYRNIWRLTGKREISLVDLEEIFSSRHCIGTRLVTLTGGEPLIPKGFLGVVALAGKQQISEQMGNV